MSTLARKLIILALGALGGIAAWPLAELVLFLQGGFPSYLVFVAVLGAAVGAVMGAFFGAAEGITTRVRSRIPGGMLLGAAGGCAGGAAGFLAGQAMLWVIADLMHRSYRDMRLVVLPVSRAVGWALLGSFVGAGEGVRARSPKKMAVGVLGGLVGGLVGGSVLEYSGLLLPLTGYPRLLGLVVLGLAIGFFYGLIEQGMSHGVLRILNGTLKGKEYLVSQGRLRIGRSAGNEIALPSYEDVADRHAVVRVKRGEVTLSGLEHKHPIVVNEEKTGERKLKYRDVIRIGSCKLIFQA